MLVERPSVCVHASAVDDWLLCRVGGFVLCSLEHRGGWPVFDEKKERFVLLLAGQITAISFP